MGAVGGGRYVNINGPSFDGFVAGCAAANGEEVWFRMRCNGIEEIDFIADFHKIDQAIAALASFAATALSERSANNKSNFQRSAILEVTSFKPVESFDPSKITIRIQTDLGAELSLDMSRDMAQLLSDSLREAASTEPPTMPHLQS